MFPPSPRSPPSSPSPPPPPLVVEIVVEIVINPSAVLDWKNRGGICRRGARATVAPPPTAPANQEPARYLRALPMKLIGIHTADSAVINPAIIFRERH